MTIKNWSIMPIELVGTNYDSRQEPIFGGRCFPQGRLLCLRLGLEQEITSLILALITVSLGVKGNRKIRTLPIFSISDSDGNYLPQFWGSSLNRLKRDQRFLVDEEFKRITFSSSYIELDKDLFIPEGFCGVGNAGLVVNLINGTHQL